MMKYLKISFLFTMSSFLVISSCMSSPGKNNSKDSLSKESSITSSGGDMYYEYSIISSGKDLHINGYMKMYISAAGSVRTEMDMSSREAAAAGKKMTSPIVLIGHSNKPDQSISIDEDTRKYSINHIDPDSINLNNVQTIQSSVTKIGEEKILGFTCIHARIISTKTLGSFYKNTDTLDVWNSTEVPLQDFFKKEMKRFGGINPGNTMYSATAAKQLKDMGCEGFLVKMNMASKNSNMKYELVKVEHRDLAKSLFEIPAGYTEEKSGF